MPPSRPYLEPLRERPQASAILLDIDGTLAPIVSRPEEAAVPPSTRSLLKQLAGRYALVACVSGRRAADARRIVGLEAITYVGNHGLERLPPHAASPQTPPELASHAAAVEAFAREAYGPELRRAGVRLEDKQSIWAFHWRDAADQGTAERELERVAQEARRRGLAVHTGRQVLEVRPPLAFDKGAAVSSLLRDQGGVTGALYVGDDLTDIDAFRALRALRADGALEHAVCVGVRSAEAPAELADQADMLVDGVAGVESVLGSLAA
jgi:trehalose 6-phosphate phosphatase